MATNHNDPTHCWQPRACASNCSMRIKGSRADWNRGSSPDEFQLMSGVLSFCREQELLASAGALASTDQNAAVQPA